MAFHIRKKRSVRRYKDKVYVYNYFEIIKTYRDPSDKTRVISEFIGYLGKKKDVSPEKIKEIKLRLKLKPFKKVRDIFSDGEWSELVQLNKKVRVDFLPTTENKNPN
ncbi:MAG: hypothetical protein V1859_02540 [archaeon]